MDGILRWLTLTTVFGSTQEFNDGQWTWTHTRLSKFKMTKYIGWATTAPVIICSWSWVLDQTVSTLPLQSAFYETPTFYSDDYTSDI